MIGRFVVFGASGDLTGRFLLPALARLSLAGDLPEDFAVVGSAREGWDDRQFREHGASGLAQHAAEVPEDVRDALVRQLQYEPADVTDADAIARVLRRLPEDDDPLVAYLALPTGIVPAAVDALGSAGLPDGSRIAVEKPFGEDLQGAQELNARLAEVLGEGWEDAVFRVDHALGMTPACNLLTLRAQNRFPEALLRSDHVAEITVLWEETLALEGRAGFYDRAGALVDVMQNHMMQVLCLLAMDLPGGETAAADLHRRKVEFLRAVRVPSEEDVAATSRRGRYTAGTIVASPDNPQRQVPDYVAEDGVDPERDTETFAEVVLAVDSPRWSGTRFRLRAGKALSARRKGITVTFRPPGGELWIGIDGPYDLSLRLSSLPGHEAPQVEEVVLTGAQPSPALPAYGEVLRDLLRGGSELSVGGEEAELAWRILGPVVDVWKRGLVPMEEYAAGAAIASRDAP